MEPRRSMPHMAAITLMTLSAAFAARPDLVKVPLSFEANQGQTDTQVRFLSRGNGYTLFLTPKEAVFRLKSKTCLLYTSPSPRD